MNMLLIRQNEIVAANLANIPLARFGDMAIKPGLRMRVGILSGAKGNAVVKASNEDHVQLELDLESFGDVLQAPIPIDLLVALPRPQMVKRILQTVGASGIRSLWFVGAMNVEKSYFSSSVVSDESIYGELVLGMEQGMSTVLPDVCVVKSFSQALRRIESRDPAQLQSALRIIADPRGDKQIKDFILEGLSCPEVFWQNCICLIGPERGWTSAELEMCGDSGYSLCSMGPRTYRVETALYFLLGQMMMLYPSSAYDVTGKK